MKSGLDELCFGCVFTEFGYGDMTSTQLEPVTSHFSFDLV